MCIFSNYLYICVDFLEQVKKLSIYSIYQIAMTFMEENTMITAIQFGKR